MARRYVHPASLSRRHALAGGTALGLLPLAPAFAQDKADPARKVFLDYTQDELDRAYDQRVWAKNAAEVIKRYTTASQAVKAKYKFETHAYGATPEEVLDIFPPAKPPRGPAPIHVHIHGGAWRILGKDDVAFLAPAFVDAGAIYVALNFANIPKVRLPDMAHQVRSATAWVHLNAARFGGDPQRVFISGHSSGGHLCAVALTTDWTRYNVPANVVKGAVCVSGMYDLQGVMLSARSDYVKISKDEEAALSPQRSLERITCPVVVAHGDGESPEFKRQARDFAARLQAGGRPNTLIEVKGLNHFEAIETMARPDGVLGQAALTQMGLPG